MSMSVKELKILDSKLRFLSGNYHYLEQNLLCTLLQMGNKELSYIHISQNDC